MMRILITLPYIVVYGKSVNPYTKSLAEGLKSAGNLVTCSIDDFWQDCCDYDIVFIQWPDTFNEFARTFGIERIAGRMDYFKKKGIKTVITCHNLHPHNNNQTTKEIYDLLYSKVDAFHHMGESSYHSLSQLYPEKYHFIVPHHVADILFDSHSNQLEDREYLHIPPQDIVIASFGEFRNSEEKRMFLQMGSDIRHQEITLLAPRMSIGRFYNGRNIVKTLQYLIQRSQAKRLKIKYKGTLLSEEEQRRWLSAADIVFIQRKDILNSGNVPLAFSQGKIVVGPQVGNVGSILKETHNFLFDPNNRQSVKNAVTDAIEAHKTTRLGQQNLEYAKKNWATEKVCSEICHHLHLLKNIR